MSEFASSISKIALFKDMSPQEILKIAAIAEDFTADRGMPILFEGDPGDALYIVREGAVIVYKGLEREELEILTVLEAGESFGEMALIDASPRSATVTAYEDSKLYIIRKSDLLDVIGDNPLLAAKLYRNFASTVANRLRTTTNKLARLAKESATMKATVDNMSSEIISLVSHEMRTPMAVIQGSAEALHDVDLSIDTQERMISAIHRHTKRMGGILDDIIQLADVQFNEAQLEKFPYDLENLIEDVSAELADKARQKDVAIDLRLPKALKDVPLHLGKMRRVIYHLLDNAIKFNRDSGTATISACVHNDTTPHSITISFQDQGPGISDKQRDELFKCFRQKSSTLDPDRKTGIGIGLALAKSVVKAHGGEICCDSAPTGGAIFSITLPMQ